MTDAYYIPKKKFLIEKLGKGLYVQIKDVWSKQVRIEFLDRKKRIYLFLP